jgi:hypothetical protein
MKRFRDNELHVLHQLVDNQDTILRRLRELEQRVETIDPSAFANIIADLSMRASKAEAALQLAALADAFDIARG